MLFDAAIALGKLSQSDLAIVNYITRHPHDVIHMTARELGEVAYVSPSTVVRLCKKAGFESFNDMKVTLARELADEESFERVDSDFPQLAQASAAQILGTVSSMERESIRKTERLLATVNWDPILAALEQAPSVSIYGTGYSLSACEVFIDNLERIGKRVRVAAKGYMHLTDHWAASCPRDEFSLFVSYSGEGSHVEDPARILLHRGLRFLAVTSDTNNTLRRLSTWCLPLAPTERRLAKTRVAPFQSTTATAYVLDVLYAELFARNYASNMRTIQNALNLQGITVQMDRATNKVVYESPELSHLEEPLARQ